MFAKTKEIIDILEEKLDEGDEFKKFKNENTSNGKYAAFFSDYKDFMQYMSLQYDLCQISSNDDVLNLFSYIHTKLEEKEEKYLQFILCSINRIVDAKPMKYELYLKLLLFIVENMDKKNEKFQDLLLENIQNRYLLCKLYENDYFSFKKLQVRIEIKDLLFYLVYFKEKISNEEYETWCESLSGSFQSKSILAKSRKLKESEIEILKMQKENPNQISIYIRNDDYDNFIDITSKNNINFDSTIPQSINENNSIFQSKIPCSFANYSAFYGSTKIFRFLLSNGARCDLNTLMCACAGGNTEIIRILVQKHISFNQKCLNKAIKYFAEIPLIDFILDNSNLVIGANEMKKAIESFNFPFFSYYLTQKSIESENSISENVLHFSVWENNYQITKFLCKLLKNYFDNKLINKKDSYKLSPLIKAVSNGYLKITKILIENGADYNDVDDKIFLLFQMKLKINLFYRSILQVAAYDGKLEIVKYLLTLNNIDKYYDGISF